MYPFYNVRHTSFNYTKRYDILLGSIILFVTFNDHIEQKHTRRQSIQTFNYLEF